MAIGVNGLGQFAFGANSAETGEDERTGLSFLELAKQQYAGGGKEDPRISSASSAKAVSAAFQMDLDQYKQYIYDIISGIPIPMSRLQEHISVTITDAAFEAMRQEPEYEAWVLNSLYENLTEDNLRIAICGGGYSAYFYGAEKEEYRSESWYPDSQGGMGGQQFQEKVKKSFWEKRAERHERYMEIAKKEGKKRQLRREQDLREALTRPDRKKDAYLSGVPAAELLSILA